jgi:hypothetical protein
MTELLNAKSEPDQQPSPVDDFQGILDVPRFQGLYREISSVSFTDQLSGSPKADISDLDRLYASELTETLAERAKLLKKLKPLFEDTGQRQAQSQIKRLMLEFFALESRLFLHNRHTREAHLALAKSLGRGWSDLLISLSRALYSVELLKTDFYPNLAWSRNEFKMDEGQVRDSVDSCLSRLKDRHQNFGFRLDDLYQDLRVVYVQTRQAAVPLKKSSATEKERESRRPLPKPNFLTDTSIAFSYMLEKQLFSEIESLDPKASKNRRKLSSEILILFQAIEYLRIFFLSRLLETEEIVLSWRGKDKAPIDAPGFRSVEAPAAETKA